MDPSAMEQTVPSNGVATTGVVFDDATGTVATHTPPV
jgi:hypothetical protein